MRRFPLLALLSVCLLVAFDMLLGAHAYPVVIDSHTLGLVRRQAADAPTSVKDRIKAWEAKKDDKPAGAKPPVHTGAEKGVKELAKELEAKNAPAAKVEDKPAEPAAETTEAVKEPPKEEEAKPTEPAAGATDAATPPAAEPATEPAAEPAAATATTTTEPAAAQPAPANNAGDTKDKEALTKRPILTGVKNTAKDLTKQLAPVVGAAVGAAVVQGAQQLVQPQQGGDQPAGAGGFLQQALTAGTQALTAGAIKGVQDAFRKPAAPAANAQAVAQQQDTADGLANPAANAQPTTQPRGTVDSTPIGSVKDRAKQWDKAIADKEAAKQAPAREPIQTGATTSVKDLAKSLDGKIPTAAPATPAKQGDKQTPAKEPIKTGATTSVKDMAKGLESKLAPGAPAAGKTTTPPPPPKTPPPPPKATTTAKTTTPKPPPPPSKPPPKPPASKPPAAKTRK